MQHNGLSDPNEVDAVLLPPGIVTEELTNSKRKEKRFTKRDFSDKTKQRVLGLLHKRKFPHLHDRPNKRQRIFTKQIFSDAQEQITILQEPIPIPDSNIHKVPDNFRKLSTSVPAHVINTYNIPKNILKDAPIDTIKSLKKDLPIIEKFNKEQLDNLVQSLKLPEYLQKQLQTKFKIIGFLYELIDEEYYALWLSKLFKMNNRTSELAEGIFTGFRFSIFQPDFTNEFVMHITKKIEKHGGTVEQQIDEMTQFVIFQNMQQIDLSHLPHIRPLTYKQLKKLEEIRMNENDLLFENIVEELPKTEIEDIYGDTSDLLRPIFIPSQTFLQNQELHLLDGIPLWRFTSAEELNARARESDIEMLELELNKEIPESLKDLWLHSRNGGILRRSLWKSDMELINIESIAGVNVSEPNADVLSLSKELGSPDMIPLYRQHNSWLVLKYYANQSTEPIVLWIRENEKKDKQVIKLSDTFEELLEILVDPSDKNVFGFLNVHTNKPSKLIEFLGNRFELYFQKSGGEYYCSHFYWKNKVTLKRCSFVLRKQIGQSLKTQKLPFEFPEHQGVKWILLVDPLHDYFLNILEDALSSCAFQGIRIASPCSVLLE